MSTYYSACDIRDVTPNYCQRLTCFVYISSLICFIFQAFLNLYKWRFKLVLIHKLCLHYKPLYHRGRENFSWFRAVTLVTLKIQMYSDVDRICILRVTIGGYRTTAGRLATWSYVITPTPRSRWSPPVRSWAVQVPRIKRLHMRRILIWTW